jgi:CBS domain-containing protein
MVMKAGDIMTTKVVSVGPDASILEAMQSMLANRISGLPVITESGKLVGIVTEGDFLRRAETGTQRRRGRWLELFMSPGKLADEYVHTHGRKVFDVMTPDPVTITEDTPLEVVVSLLEDRRIKRLPVVRSGAVVGIVSRANLLHALASLAREQPGEEQTDAAIREQIYAELNRQRWIPKDFLNVVVRNGGVELWGTILDERERQAVRVAVENVPGVKHVADHLVWVEPMSGMVFEPVDETPGSTQKG